MKTLKKLLWAILALVVLVVVAFLFVDSIAKTAVESGATRALGVETTVDELDLNFLARNCVLRQLRVENPTGFAAAYFLSAGELELEVAPGSLLKDKVIVPLFRLDTIALNLERTLTGANYDIILENVRGSKEDAPSGPDAPKDEAKKFLIGELVIRDVLVNVRASAGGLRQELELKIPEVRLENVGSHEGRGVAIVELSRRIVLALLQAVTERGGGILPGELLEDLRSDLDGLESIPIEVLGDVRKSLEGLGGAAGVIEEPEKAVEEVGGALEEGLDKLRGGLEGSSRGKEGTEREE